MSEARDGWKHRGYQVRLFIWDFIRLHRFTLSITTANCYHKYKLRYSPTLSFLISILFKQLYNYIVLRKAFEILEQLDKILFITRSVACCIILAEISKTTLSILLISLHHWATSEHSQRKRKMSRKWGAFASFQLISWMSAFLYYSVYFICVITVKLCNRGIVCIFRTVIWLKRFSVHNHVVGGWECNLFYIHHEELCFVQSPTNTVIIDKLTRIISFLGLSVISL